MITQVIGFPPNLDQQKKCGHKKCNNVATIEMASKTNAGTIFRCQTHMTDGNKIIHTVQNTQEI